MYLNVYYGVFYTIHSASFEKSILTQKQNVKHIRKCLKKCLLEKTHIRKFERLAQGHTDSKSQS